MLVTVLTCLRPVSYIQQTLDAIDATLDPSLSRLLICDGGPARARRGWDVLALDKAPRTNGRINNRAPGWQAIREARARDLDLLFLEDDVVPLAPAFHPPPAELAWTSFFHRLRAPGTYPCASFDMSQAVLIPRRSLAWLADFAQRPDWGRVVGFDIALAVAGKAAQWSYELAPNGVRHIGDVSAVSG